MNSLPKKFPEYLIMYNTLSKKISELKDKKTGSLEFKEIQNKIKKYESERVRIRSMFPENFFENLTDK